MMEGISTNDVKDIKSPNFENITIAAINKSDAIIKGAEKLNTKIDNHIKNQAN